MALIQGMHHVCMKCCSEAQFEETKKFYGEILGLEQVRAFPNGLMYQIGGGVLLEIFSDGNQSLPQGVWQHIALATQDVDGCVEAVRAGGYPITMEPRDIVVASEPPMPARIAFCIGPMGEEIEFFREG